MSPPSFHHYNCDKCQFATLQRADFFNHMITNHCTVAYHCTLCSYFSNDRRKVAAHYMESHCRKTAVFCHTNKSSIKAATAVPAMDLSCVHQAASKNTASSSSSPSSKPALMICPECFISFGSSEEWRCHMTQVHRWISCLLCSESFQNYCQLEVHVRSKHCNKIHQESIVADNNNNKQISSSIEALLPPTLPLSVMRNLLATPRPHCEASSSTTHPNNYHPYAFPINTNAPMPSVVMCRICGKQGFNDINEFYNHVASQHLFLPPDVTSSATDNNNQQQQQSAYTMMSHQPFASSSSPSSSSSPPFLPPMLPMATVAAAALARIGHHTATDDQQSKPRFSPPPFDTLDFFRLNTALSGALKLLHAPLPPLPTTTAAAATTTTTTPLSIGLNPSSMTSATSSSASSSSSSSTNNQCKTPPAITIDSFATVTAPPTAVQEMALKCISEMTLRNSSHRQTAKQPFICKLCSRNLSSAFSLLCHYRSHAGIKPYLCSVCHARFTQQNSLSYHLLIHKNLKPFTCQICTRSYRNKQLYKKHMRLHSNIVTAAAAGTTSAGVEVTALSATSTSSTTTAAELLAINNDSLLLMDEETIDEADFDDYKDEDATERDDGFSDDVTIAPCSSSLTTGSSNL